MKKQIGMAVMVLMFAMAQGCSKGTAASVEATEFVAEIRETEGEKQEEMESGTSEKSPYSELEKLTGPEITETEVESKEQTESKKNNSLEPVAAGSMEDTETSTKVDSEKKIPRVSAEVPERASGTSATEALRESVQPSSSASQELSPIAPETEPVFTNPPETQPESEPPVETSPVSELETEAPPETEPKTAYDYPFDMDAIRSDCIGIGQGMGLALDGSLTPGNAAWWNPVTASQSNQGTGLKQSLRSYVSFHTPGNLASYGMDEITVFNIYCEPRGNGEYSVYFLFG